MSARSALTVVGQAVGYYFGGNIGAAIGGTIGSCSGSSCDGPPAFEVDTLHCAPSPLEIIRTTVAPDGVPT